MLRELRMKAGAAALFTMLSVSTFAAETKGADALDSVIAGEWRSAENKARDKYRHPKESLTFWGLKPGMTVLELQPGGGWWTEILAPYAHKTGGKYYATHADLSDPAVSEGARKSRAAFEQRFAAKPDVYGKVTIVNFQSKSIAPPPNTFDFALVARGIHGWVMGNRVDPNFSALFKALKPGGILAIEQHRAAPGKMDPGAKDGYVSEDFVIQQAQKAGFKLVGKSEINANPKDTKDHPFGVWTLPPTRASSSDEGRDPPNPNFDHSKYDAIGESDRMTLKFQKPS